MKRTANNSFTKLFILCMGFLITTLSFGQSTSKEIKGIILDEISKMPLESVIINLEETNISTITNSEGQFALKIPQGQQSDFILISYLGYKTERISINDFSSSNEVFLREAVTKLSEVNLSTFKNAENLVRRVFKNKAKNNANQSVVMTAFYRETIKKRNRNVSLTEAIVNLHKGSYSSGAKDVMKIDKARKSTDYRRLDTLALKLQGGPFSTLYLDIMKYPEYIFTRETISEYDFSFGTPSTINGRNVYSVKFEQKENIESVIGYHGKLFIDVASLALVSASYGLDLKDKEQVGRLLVKKKPRDVVAYPLEANYRVDYREKNGKWYYGYGNVELTFKINKKRKLFNSVYTLSSEMAITDWEVNTSSASISSKESLKPNIIISDAISGFSDPNFWGEYNLIEPEKSI